MLAAKGNKKIKILFYIFVFIFLSTISFFERTKIFGGKVFFEINKFEIYGYKKVDHIKMKNKLSIFFGQSLLFMNSKYIEDILDKNKLVSEYIIQKKYPHTIKIKIKEVNFVAS